MVVRRVKVGMSVAGLSITDHSRRRRLFSTQLVLYERKRYEILPASIIVQGTRKHHIDLASRCVLKKLRFAKQLYIFHIRCVTLPAEC